MGSRTGKSKDQRQYIRNLEGQIASLRAIIAGLNTEKAQAKADADWALHQKRCTPEQEAAIEAAIESP